MDEERFLKTISEVAATQLAATGCRPQQGRYNIRPEWIAGVMRWSAQSDGPCCPLGAWAVYLHGADGYGTLPEALCAVFGMSNNYRVGFVNGFDARPGDRPPRDTVDYVAGWEAGALIRERFGCRWLGED